MALSIPPLNINSSSSAESGNYGDVFFGAVEVGKKIDLVDKLAMPVLTSVISALIVYMVLKNKKTGA